MVLCSITILGITIATSTLIGGGVMAERYIKNNVLPGIRNWWSNRNSNSSIKKSPTVHVRPVELRVLGFENSGKTQFLNALRNIPNPVIKDQTIGLNGCIEIPVFTFKSADGTKSKEISAKDINGTHDFLVRNTIKFVSEADYLLFCCDVVSYLQDINGYKDNVNGVLNSIYLLNPTTCFKKVRIILTYEDELLEKLALTSEQAITKFKSEIENTEYFKYRCDTVSTFNQQQVRQLFSRILYGE